MKIKQGSKFYDTQTVFELYSRHRKSKNNPNDILELPVMRDLLTDIEGKDILDLGCGDGDFCQYLAKNGAKSVLGIDGSKNMIGVAGRGAKHKGLSFRRINIEDFHFKPRQYDVVVSRLVLHYLKNLSAVFKKVYGSLRPDGQFIFSVEHPCLTAGPTDWMRYRHTRQNGTWAIDQYFDEGKRDVLWMEACVRKYHRTLETYFSLMTRAGFCVEQVRESNPSRAIISDKALLRRLSRMPLFLFFKASRSTL